METLFLFPSTASDGAVLMDPFSGCTFAGDGAPAKGGSLVEDPIDYQMLSHHARAGGRLVTDENPVETDRFSAPPARWLAEQSLELYNLSSTAKTWRKRSFEPNGRTATKLSLPCLTELLQMTIVYLEEFKSIGLKVEA